MGFHVVKGKSGTHLIPHHTRGDDRLPLGTAAMAAVAAAAFLLGSGTGVILSPDQASPSPDWQGYVDDAVAEQMAEHLEFDHEPDHTHAPEVTPSVEPSPTPTPSPAASGRQSTTPGATARPTAAPTSRPTPTARPAPSVAPSPTCFRPGKPRSSPDPCAWPPDG